MKRKNVLALVLAAVMAGSMIGCSSGSKPESGSQETSSPESVPQASKEAEASSASKEDEKPVELITAWWGNQTRNDRFQKMLDLYAKEHGIRIETQMSVWDDYLVSIQAAAASSDMPDLMMLQGSYYQEYVDSGLLTDLTPYVESGALDTSSISDSILSATSIDGKLYGICAGINSISCIYNKTLLDTNNITVKDNMTLDEFAALCKEVYENTGYKTYFNYESQLMEYMVRANDVVLFGKGKIGGSSAKDIADLFLLIEQGYQEGWLMDYSLLGSVSSVEEHPMVYGTSPEMSSWCAFYNSNQCTALQNAAPEGTELALTTAPSKDVKKSAYLREAMSLVVPAKTQGQNQDAVVELLNWWINSKEANEIILGEPGVPANGEVASQITSQVDDTQAKIFTYVTEVVTPVASVANPPAGNGMTEAENLLMELAQYVEYGQMTGMEAAEKFFTEGNEIMAAAAKR